MCTSYYLLICLRKLYDASVNGDDEDLKIETNPLTSAPTSILKIATAVITVATVVFWLSCLIAYPNWFTCKLRPLLMYTTNNHKLLALHACKEFGGRALYSLLKVNNYYPFIFNCYYLLLALLLLLLIITFITLLLFVLFLWW